MLSVPVMNEDNTPLMPTTPSRASRWIKRGEATPFWKKGVFCVRLRRSPSGTTTQDVAVGVDPGSKKEGFTVASATKTFLNVQTDAVDFVKKKIEERRNARRARRQRNTPCRKNKTNRKRGCIPPSTKARWQWKLRILNWLRKLFPITHYVVEDVAAVTKPGERRWNASFSPLAVGKQWFYDQIRKLGQLTILQGFETKTLRDLNNLEKSKAKLSSDWNAHCVDSFVLAKSTFEYDFTPDDKEVFEITPIKLCRRQLHAFQFAKGGVRRSYGGTRSLTFKRGSLVTHPKWGLTYVGGTSKERVSLHELKTGKRLSQQVKPSDLTYLTHSSWRWHSSHP